MITSSSLPPSTVEKNKKEIAKIHTADRHLLAVGTPNVETPSSIEKIIIIAMSYGMASKDLEDYSIYMDLTNI